MVELILNYFVQDCNYIHYELICWSFSPSIDWIVWFVIVIDSVTVTQSPKWHFHNTFHNTGSVSHFSCKKAKHLKINKAANYLATYSFSYALRAKIWKCKATKAVRWCKVASEEKPWVKYMHLRFVLKDNTWVNVLSYNPSQWRIYRWSCLSLPCETGALDRTSLQGNVDCWLTVIYTNLWLFVAQTTSSHKTFHS